MNKSLTTRNFLTTILIVLAILLPTQKTYGGSLVDSVGVAAETGDGGFIVAGNNVAETATQHLTAGWGLLNLT